jgi:hypothetical protein
MGLLRDTDINRQKVFDTVVAHLLTQNEQCRSTLKGVNTCAYRGKFGLKCAVGVLIPDEVYSPIIEGESVNEIFDPQEASDDGEMREALTRVKKAIRLRTNDERYMLESLQMIHDNFEPDQWQYELRKLAAELRLRFHAPN